MTTLHTSRPRATRKWIAIVGGVAAVMLFIAGCGGGGYGGGEKSAAASGSGATSVALGSTSLGKVLVDGNGRTLYLFEADKGTKSACSGACAGAWPPVVTGGKPVAGAGITAAKLGTAKRSDGSTGVTYNGHPLYTYAGDGAPGDTTGEGIDDFGAKWFVLSAAGTTVNGSGPAARKPVRVQPEPAAVAPAPQG